MEIFLGIQLLFRHRKPTLYGEINNTVGTCEILCKTVLDFNLSRSDLFSFCNGEGLLAHFSDFKQKGEMLQNPHLHWKQRYDQRLWKHLFLPLVILFFIWDIWCCFLKFPSIIIHPSIAAIERIIGTIRVLRIQSLPIELCSALRSSSRYNVYFA